MICAEVRNDRVAWGTMEENLILLVEDCAEDASLVQTAFKKWGINNPVRVVPDGEQAVDYLAGKGNFTDRKYISPSLLGHSGPETAHSCPASRCSNGYGRSRALRVFPWSSSAARRIGRL